MKPNVDQPLVADVRVQEGAELVCDTDSVRQVQADGDEGNHRHHALIGEGRDLVGDLLVGKDLEHHEDGLEVLHAAFLPAGQVIHVQVPHVMRDEPDNPLDDDRRPADPDLRPMHDAVKHFHQNRVNSVLLSF